LVDVSTAFISQIETGRYKPSLQTVVYIAEVLDTSIDMLIDNERNTYTLKNDIAKILSDCTPDQLVIARDLLRELFKKRE